MDQKSSCTNDPLWNVRVCFSSIESTSLADTRLPKQCFYNIQYTTWEECIPFELKKYQTGFIFNNNWLVMMYTSSRSFRVKGMIAYLNTFGPLRNYNTSLRTFPLTQRLWTRADLGGLIHKKPVTSTLGRAQQEIRLFKHSKKKKTRPQCAHTYKTYSEFSYGLREHKNGFKKIKSHSVDSKDNQSRMTRQVTDLHKRVIKNMTIIM